MRQTLGVARGLYALAPGTDRTFVAAELLEVCRNDDEPVPLPGGRCRNDGAGLPQLIKYVEHFDCAVTDCDTTELKAFFSPRHVPTPSPVEALPMSGAAGQVCASRHLSLQPSKQCGECARAVNVEGCFGHFEDSGIRNEGRLIYTQCAKMATAASRAAKCGTLPARVQAVG